MTHFAWWESVVTTHPDLPSALDAALLRGVDVDEDVGAPGMVSLPRIQPSGEPGVKDIALDMTAVTAAIAELDLAANARGWELVGGPTIIGRQTKGFMSEMRDLVSERLANQRAPRIMVNVIGPWTFGATVEVGGHPIIADRPAFRDVALTLGEGLAEHCRWLHAETGSQIVVGLHEPMVAAVLDGLPGPTRWSGLKPVDREHILGVWRRLLSQLPHDVPVILHDCPFELLKDVATVGFARVSVPAQRLVADNAMTKDKDAVAELIAAGQNIGLKLPRTSARTLEEIDAIASNFAQKMIKLWQQWSFDPAEFSASVAVAAGIRRQDTAVVKPARAAAAAAVVRTCAVNITTG